MKGKIFVAGPYNEKTISLITSHFQRLLQSDITFTVKEDKSLIGGFLAIVDGRLYDATVLTRTNKLQDHMFIKD